MNNLQEFILNKVDNYLPKKQTILVVDDNADLLEVIQCVLELEHYEVLTASSGQEALSVVSGLHKPSLILLDLNLNDMSGIEVLCSMDNALPQMIRTVPVVFLTAMDRVPASKAVGFIRKPIDIEKFLTAVRGFMDTKMEFKRCS